jgi:hypothetical protein
MTGPAAGWYPDPSGRLGQRYWNGVQWTDHHAPNPSPGQPHSPTVGSARTFGTTSPAAMNGSDVADRLGVLARQVWTAILGLVDKVAARFKVTRGVAGSVLAALSVVVVVLAGTVVGHLGGNPCDTYNHDDRAGRLAIDDGSYERELAACTDWIQPLERCSDRRACRLVPGPERFRAALLGWAGLDLTRCSDA